MLQVVGTKSYKKNSTLYEFQNKKKIKAKNKKLKKEM